MSLNIREINKCDIEVAGKYIFEAFKGIAEQHNFPLDFESVEACQGFAGMWIDHPEVYGIAAEQNGEFVGSNFLTEFDEIRGVGPITVNPAVQSRGTGRELMKNVIARGQSAEGIRLVQAAFNTKSMSLYASLGFDVREPLALMHGKPSGRVSENIVVRPMNEEDLVEAGELHRRIHGFSRNGELGVCLNGFKPFVAERDGRIVGYTSTVSMWQLNHGVAENDQDMFDLLTGASNQLGQPVSFLLPTRQAGFHRWALNTGLRMSQPLTLMTMGKYKEPDAAWFPSVFY
ncbi:MAG: GNAT family N-acetyltransferase [Pyrinomonadaceae bacterium]